MKSSDEEDTGGMQTDWRSLRARLVAAEQSSLVTSNPPHTISTTNNKWAHTLHAPEKGCLLVATHSLDGVHIFERTVILILTLIPTPTGIILNRPSLMSIKEANSTSIASANLFSEQPLLFGGPVDSEVFLVSSKKPGVVGVFDEVMNGVYYGGRESVGCAAELVRRDAIDLKELKFFDGCCQWEDRQLGDEIASGCWNVVACGAGVVERCVGREKTWEKLMRIVGQRKS